MSLEPFELVKLTAQHTRHLRHLIGPPLEPTIQPAASKTVMLGALYAAELDLLQTIAVLLPTLSEQQPVCGVWTLRELVGHLADWDHYFLNWLAGLTGHPTQELYWDNNGDRFNAWLNEQRRDEMWEQTWRGFRGNRQMLHTHLSAVSEEDFLREHHPTPSFPTVYHCAWSALEHYLDHAAGLRRELQMPVPEELYHFHGPYTD